MHLISSQIKTLIFDLGNVIIDIDIPGADQRLKALSGISFLEPEDDDLKVFLNYECGFISEDQFLNHFIRKTKGRVEAYEVLHCWNSMLGEIPVGRMELLSSLADHYRLIVLSNTNRSHIDWLNRYLGHHYGIPGLDHIVHTAYYSHELGCRKPDGEIYEFVLAREGILPQATLFFDDLPQNVEAAKELGIGSFLVTPGSDIVHLVPQVLKSM